MAPHPSRTGRRGKTPRPTGARLAVTGGRSGTRSRDQVATVGADFDPIRRRTLNDEVYIQLRERLMEGALAPGAALTIRDLAASFGISPMPVREALRRLVAEHALVLLPNRTVAVPAPSADRFREITEIRMALEGLAAELAVDNIEPAEIARMRRNNAAMVVSADLADTAYFANNREFHFTLYRGSRRPTLITLIESLWLQIGPVLTYVQQHADYRRNTATKHHGRILAGLEKRDKVRVRTAVVDDLADAARIVARYL